MIEQWKAEEFVRAFRELWIDHRITHGLESFRAQAAELVALFDKEHEVGAARKTLVAAVPLSERTDMEKVLGRFYKSAENGAESILRPIAKEIYLSASRTNPNVGTEWLACSDPESLGKFITKHGDLFYVAGVYLELLQTAWIVQ
jgi:hypothetical protein